MRFPKKEGKKRGGGEGEGSWNGGEEKVEMPKCNALPCSSHLKRWSNNIII